MGLFGRSRKKQEPKQLTDLEPKTASELGSEGVWRPTPGLMWSKDEPPRLLQVYQDMFSGDVALVEVPTTDETHNFSLV